MQRTLHWSRIILQSCRVRAQDAMLSCWLHTNGCPASVHFRSMLAAILDMCVKAITCSHIDMAQYLERLACACSCG